jgi:hypothetical protein
MEISDEMLSDNGKNEMAVHKSIGTANKIDELRGENRRLMRELARSVDRGNQLVAENGRLSNELLGVTNKLMASAKRLNNMERALRTMAVKIHCDTSHTTAIAKRLNDAQIALTSAVCEISNHVDAAMNAVDEYAA